MHADARKGVPRIFHWGQERKAEGRERGGVLGEGSATFFPPAGALGCAVSSPAGFVAEPRPPKGFPLFSVLRHYNIVNCRLLCSHWGPSPLNTPVDARYNVDKPIKMTMIQHNGAA